MGNRLDLNSLCQLWLHSREEDTATETVYRPATHSFPPSRGRAGLEFSPGGTLIRSLPGRADVAAVTEGKWHVKNEDGADARIEIDGIPRLMTIGSVGPDRLTIKKEG
jgi:hypothetical protein